MNLEKGFVKGRHLEIGLLDNRAKIRLPQPTGGEFNKTVKIGGDAC